MTADQRVEEIIGWTWRDEVFSWVIHEEDGGERRVNRDRFRAYRDRKRGGPPRTLAPCGTIAAVRRHERAGEPLDDACREARRAHNARQYRARKG